MGKFLALASLFVLAGSTGHVRVEMSSDHTSVTLSDELVEQYTDSPLTKSQWVSRNALQSVPVFATGTSIGDVRDALVESNIMVLREWPGYIAVREGVPLIDTSGKHRESYLYGFTDGRLSLGPLQIVEAISRFESQGLTAAHIETLRLFVEADPSNPDPYNALAWLLATHADPTVRDGEAAVELAQHALSLEDVPDWNYVDTLAAAYAAAGDFGRAVEEQHRAIYLQGGYDRGASTRLVQYLLGQIYVHTAGAMNEANDAERNRANQELIEQAAAGSAEAQWSLAVFYISNDITESDGVIAPGVFWLEQAAANGHQYAANEVGYCYLMGYCGVDMNYVTAASWFRRALEHEDVDAAFNLGRLLAFSYGEQRDDVEATRLLKTAADSGNNSAAFQLAFRYGQGVGTAADLSARNRYLRQVGAAGYEPADYLLDDFYFQRFHGAAAIGAALERAAVRPTELADEIMNLVGIMDRAYETHTDIFVVQFPDASPVEYNAEYGPHLIFNLVRVAASLGSKKAQSRMVSYYEEGDVVPRSLPEAHYWRQRAGL